MRKRFTFVREDRPGEEWAERFVVGRDEARRWYLGDRRGPPPSMSECRDAVGRHMPELLDGYDLACARVGDDPLDRAILSQYRPAPEAAGCSVAVWHDRAGAALVRNYDYPLDVVSDRFELTDWSGRRVIGKAQRPWGGLLDGMNDAGLAVAITFGGSPAQGLGFAVILIVRYLLETCGCVDEAVEALSRVPVAQSQNVVLLDRSGAHATVYLGPEREPGVSRDRAATNHQETAVRAGHAARTNSVGRLKAVEAALREPDMTLDALVGRFLEHPLYSRVARSPTAYSAVYRPAEGVVEYLWPGRAVRQGFERFEERVYEHDYGDLA